MTNLIYKCVIINNCGICNTLACLFKKRKSFLYIYIYHKYVSAWIYWSFIGISWLRTVSWYHTYYSRDSYKIQYIFPTISKFLMIQKPLKFADVRRLYDAIPRYVRLVAWSVFYPQRTTPHDARIFAMLLQRAQCTQNHRISAK